LRKIPETFLNCLSVLSMQLIQLLQDFLVQSLHGRETRTLPGECPCTFTRPSFSRPRSSECNHASSPLLKGGLILFPSSRRPILPCPLIFRSTSTIRPRYSRLGIPPYEGSCFLFRLLSSCPLRTKALLQLMLMGHSSHNGRRAVQIVAPRSMSASVQSRERPWGRSISAIHHTDRSPTSSFLE
jgi:hypothetical protein